MVVWCHTELKRVYLIGESTNTWADTLICFINFVNKTNFGMTHVATTYLVRYTQILRKLTQS